MRLDDTQHLATVNWYATAQYACSYLPDAQARSQVAVLSPAQAAGAYSELITRGFRRSGVHVYRPQCDHCKACIPTRINVADFVPSRSQRRAAKALDGLTIRQVPLGFYAEHWALYQRYQTARHLDGSATDSADSTHNSDEANTPQAYSQFLLRSHVDSAMVELRHAQGEYAGALYAVTLVDTVADGLSAVYTFFEPQSEHAKGSPGTACVLWMVAQARALNLPYVYLGYWISESRKMAYKSNFHPLEVLRNGTWVGLD